MTQQDFLQDFSNSIISDIDYIAITTNYDKPNATTQISDSGQNEIYRVSASFSLIGSDIKDSISLGDITIAEDTISSVTNQKVFNLTSVSGFKEGDAVVINYDQAVFEKRKIIDITGNTITLDKECNITLSAGMKVILSLEWVHLISGGSSSANTGFTMITRNLSLIKLSSTLQTFDIIFGGKIK
jgi:hypothetical protein